MQLSELRIQTVIHEDLGLIPGFAQCVKGSSVAISCGVGQRRGLDPTLLWLWRRPAAVAPTGPVAWETPYAAGAALKRQKTERKKKKKQRKRETIVQLSKESKEIHIHK